MKLFIISTFVFLLIVSTVNAGFFEDAKSWLSGAAETVGSAATSVKDTVVEKGGEAVEWSKQAGQKVGDFASNLTWEDVKEGAKNGAIKAGDGVSSLYNKASEAISNTEKKAE